MSGPPAQRRSESGFTLIELILAVVIMGIAFAAILDGMTTAIRSSEFLRRKATVATILNTFSEAIEASPVDRKIAHVSGQNITIDSVLEDLKPGEVVWLHKKDFTLPELWTVDVGSGGSNEFRLTTRIDGIDGATAALVGWYATRLPTFTPSTGAPPPTSGLPPGYTAKVTSVECYLNMEELPCTDDQTNSLRVHVEVQSSTSSYGFPVRKHRDDVLRRVAS